VRRVLPGDVVDGWYDEELTKPASYSHDGETCPVHEWLEQADCAEAHRIMKQVQPAPTDDESDPSPAAVALRVFGSSGGRRDDAGA